MTPHLKDRAIDLMQEWGWRKADHDLNTQLSILILSQTVPTLSFDWKVIPEIYNTRFLDMYKCHDIRMCKNIGKHTHFLTCPQYFKYKSCVFSAAKSCSHWLSHPHCAGARISYIYIPTCIYLLFSMIVRNATFLRKLFFRYFCRDRLGTA